MLLMVDGAALVTSAGTPEDLAEVWDVFATESRRRRRENRGTRRLVADGRPGRLQTVRGRTAR